MHERKGKCVCHYMYEQQSVLCIFLGPNEIHGSDYHLIAADIRNVGELEQKLASHGLDKRLRKNVS